MIKEIIAISAALVFETLRVALWASLSTDFPKVHYSFACNDFLNLKSLTPIIEVWGIYTHEHVHVSLKIDKSGKLSSRCWQHTKHKNRKFPGITYLPINWEHFLTVIKSPCLLSTNFIAFSRNFEFLVPIHSSVLCWWNSGWSLSLL